MKKGFHRSSREKKLERFHNIRFLYLLIVFGILIVVAVGVYATFTYPTTPHVNPINPGHNSTQVFIKIGSSYATLQDAINTGFFLGFNQTPVPTTSFNPHGEYELANQILITFDGKNMSLQQAVDNDSFSAGTIPATRTTTVPLGGHYANAINVSINSSTQSKILFMNFQNAITSNNLSSICTGGCPSGEYCDATTNQCVQSSPTLPSCPTGNMWLLDWNGQTVVKVSPVGVMTTYTGFTSYPYSIAFDGTNMWTVNYNGNYQGTFGTKIAPNGAMTNYNYIGSIGPTAVAFNGTNMWVVEGGRNLIYEFSLAGQFEKSYSFSGNPDPDAIAFDGTNMWTANYYGSVTKVEPNGTMTTYTGLGADPSTGNSYPTGIAFDGTNMWTANYAGKSVTKIAPNGTMTTYPLSEAPYAIAFDGTNMWVTNPSNDSVTKVSPTGVTTVYAGTGRDPVSIAFDGTNMWTANAMWSNPTTKIAPNGTMTNYSNPNIHPQAIAFDGSVLPFSKCTSS